MNNIKIRIAKKAGFCFGVQRAVDLVEKVLKENQSAYCWGDLVHNPIVIEGLKKEGLKIIESIEDFPEKAVFIVRSHGMTQEDLSKVKNKTSKIIDATCPFVIKAQKSAEIFKNKEKKVLIIGDKNHVEVEGIKSNSGNETFIVDSVKELHEIKKQLVGKIGVVCQTTQKHSKLDEITTEMKFMNLDFEVADTICLDTTNKQQEVLDIPSGTHLLIVIGGLHSSNTTKLAEIGRQKGIKTYHIETATNISKEWFTGDESVFLTAGASTPPREVLEAKVIIKNFTFE